MIDLGRVREVLKDCESLVDGLDGCDLDETSTHVPTGMSKAKARDERVRMSRELLLLSHRLDLAGALVMNEYHFARGEVDPLSPEREL